MIDRPGMNRVIRTILLPFTLTVLLPACAVWGPRVPERTEILNLSTTTSEGRRVVSGHLSFPSYEHSLKIRTSGFMPETISAGFSGKKKDFGQVDPSTSYQVVLLTTVETAPFYLSNSVVRVSRDGRVIYDESLCQLHHRPMKRQIEEGVSAGDYPNSFHSLQERKFPNSGVVYLSCDSGINHPNWRCPTCHDDYRRAAKQYGIQTH